MQNTLFENLAGSFKLNRPGITSSQSLQAWDAADSYLIEHTLSKLANQPIAILNDQFGALGVCLNEQTKIWISDSFCAHNAIINNFTLNQTKPNFPLFNPLESWESCSDVKTAIIRLPKNLSYLTHLLKRCSEEGIQEILIAGMMKHLPKNILQFLQKFGDVQRLPFKKKATIYQLSISKPIDLQYPKHLTLNNVELITHANVFGRDKLDPGAAFVIEQISKLPTASKVADLCCGSGILGISYLKQHPESYVSFFDESYMAIKSTIDSCKKNSLTNIHTQWDDGLKNSSEKFDLIICNPPFHEEHTVGDHIAKRLFNHAKQHLNTKGQLIIVGNRHLGYHSTLKSNFKNIEILASNSKFVLIIAND